MYHSTKTVFGLVTLLLAGCGKTEPVESVEPELGQDNQVEVTDAQFKTGGLELGRLATCEFSENVTANGVLDVPPTGHASVSAYEGGYVKKIGLIPGQKVSRGSVLFTIENPVFVEMQQEFYEAREQVNYLQSDYERQKKLREENVTSEKKFLKAESDYRMKKAQMDGLRKRLAILNIRPDSLDSSKLVSVIPVYSPISGSVTKVNAMQGQYIDPTFVSVELVNIDHLHLELNIFEKDVVNVAIGDKISYRVPGAGSNSYEGDIEFISREVDEGSRTIRVHGHLRDKDHRPEFVPGMFVEAEIKGQLRQSACLPETAVIESGEEFIVLIALGQNEATHTFEKREVSVGKAENGFYPIANPEQFGADQDILIRGGFNLISDGGGGHDH